MYAESVLYVKVEMYVRKFEKLRKVMVMVKNPFCFMNCLKILVFWMKFKQFQNRDLPPHVVAVRFVS
jgi:hypothetical protein